MIPATDDTATLLRLGVAARRPQVRRAEEDELAHEATLEGQEVGASREARGAVGHDIDRARRRAGLGAEVIEQGFDPLVERQAGARDPHGQAHGIEKGPLAGYPLSDFKATLFDGSFHTVDSNELSFKIAASMALKEGVQQAKPALLEPIMLVEIRVPDAYMGEVTRDLNGRRGRVLGMDSVDGMQVITAHVPQAELFNYATELRSLAQGRGTFTATLDHYEDVPSHLAEKVIAEHRKTVEAGHGGH